MRVDPELFTKHVHFEDIKLKHIFSLLQAEVHRIVIKGKFIKKIKVTYRNEKGRLVRVRLPGNKVPRGGRIEFKPPVEMKSFKIQILKVSGRKKVAKNFRVNVYGCVEKPKVPPTTPPATPSRKRVIILMDFYVLF